MKNIKCPNCGASDFIQTSDDMYQCAYCSATIKNDSSVKDNFLKELDKTSGGIIFIKPTIKEEDFHKRALSHLVVNKYSPQDLADCKFSHVKYRYIYFAVLDIDFFAVSTTSNVSPNLFNNTIDVSSSHQSNFMSGKNMWIKLSDDIEDNFLSYVTENYDNLMISSEKVSKKYILSQNINVPENYVIDHTINNSVNNYKKTLTPQLPSNAMCLHQINSIQIIALPEYSIEFEYKQKSYTISSLANNLNLAGQMPTKGDQIKARAEKKILPISLVSSLAALAAIVFAIIHISNKLLGLIVVDIVLGGVCLLCFLLSLFAFSVVCKKLNKQEFEQRKQRLNEILAEKSLKLTADEQNYIEKIIRWFK
ncbi:MAG: hypothetical protein IJA69_00225 [Clostridia bacterium]|nr:hypothetical protein [Clostridia bacterium]